MSLVSTFIQKILAQLGTTVELQVIESAIVGLAEKEGPDALIRLLVLPQSVEKQIVAKTGGDLAAVEAAKVPLEEAMSAYIKAFEPPAKA